MSTFRASQPAERPYVRLQTPDRHYMCSEPFTAVIHPAGAARYDVRLTAGHTCEVLRRLTKENRLEVRAALPAGRYQFTVRCAPVRKPAEADWSDWSFPCPLEIHEHEHAQRVEALRVREHRHSLLAQRDVNGILTITDPWALPPACPRGEKVKWFRTPVYEGATTLLDEVADYYRDPRGYFLDAIAAMRARGVGFVTWHDVLEGRIGEAPVEALLQFDVDGGPRAMARLIPPLVAMDVRATLMIHREAHDWYEYGLDDLPLEAFSAAEAAGWTIGFHNNAVGNAQRMERAGEYGEAVMAEAADRFRDDVARLRALFNIRTYTAHGGNVLNHRLSAPPDVEITCVDRVNAGAWEGIRSMFSDGGFAARPCPLREKLDRLVEGVHFFRHHPSKYGYDAPPWDVPPLLIEDATARGVEVDEAYRAALEAEIDKQRRWLAHRRAHRLGRCFSHATEDRPISRRFGPLNEIALPERGDAARQRRYPDPAGDPLVFWQRMVERFAPAQSRALPTGRPLRGGDERVEGVLVHDLSGSKSPGKLVDACASLLAADGVGLFCLRDDTHPLNGALFDPRRCPLWRRADEPARRRVSAWSFDQRAVDALFSAWREVTVESFSHHWFVIARPDRER